MKKTIIECKKGHYGKWRTLKLFVDREHVTDIKQGQTIEIEIENNAKQIYGKMDWGKTKVLLLNELNEHTLKFRQCLSTSGVGWNPPSLGCANPPLGLNVISASF